MRLMHSPRTDMTPTTKSAGAMRKLKLLLLSALLMVTVGLRAQEKFTALEQHQISIETPGLFAQSDAFTIDFGAMRSSDYSFPLPVGKATATKEYNVEIQTTKGDAVKAMFAGTVRLSKNNPPYGNVVVVRHDNGQETVYANNAQNLVKVGDRVKAGQTVAIVGTEAGKTYCLFAVMLNGNRINPEIVFGLESHRLHRHAILCKKTSSWKVDISVIREPRVDKAVAEQWWCYPLPGAKVISPYGRRGGRRHTGVDIKTKPNDSICAAFDGEVVFSGPYSGYGNLIRIRHANGLETYYSHNSKNLVAVGDRVKAGQVIALTGRTGRATTEHLHFETRINGQPIDPSRYFDHQHHTLRLDAFTKTKSGYVVKRK